MKLIVGLGNPGRLYKKTRHNVGFMVIDAISDKYNLDTGKKKFNGIYKEVVINGEKIILLKPQKYMNLSGEVIKSYMDFFKISVDNIFIIQDDLDLGCGYYKLKYQGGSGGHNGLKNIEQNIGTQQYKRLKIGISNNKNINTKDYVLGKFTKEEEKIIASVIDKSIEIIEDYIKLTFDNLMNKYNNK